MRERNSLTEVLAKFARLVGYESNDVSGKGYISKYGQAYARAAETDLQLLKKIKDEDENVALACRGVAESVVGPGHEVVAEGVGITENIKDKIADICREFASKNNLDKLMFQTVDEFYGLGVSFTEKIFDGKELAKLVRLPVDDDWQVKLPEKTGGAQFVEAVQGSTGVKFTPDTMILWQYNLTSSGDWQGRGICWYMAQELDYTLIVNDERVPYRVPPLYVIMRAMKDDIRLITHHLAPKVIVNGPGMGKQWVEDTGSKFGTMGPGEIMTTDADRLETHVVQADPRFRLDVVKDIYNEYVMRICQVPESVMYGKNVHVDDKTDAQYNLKVMSIRRDLSRTYENEVYMPLLSQSGIDTSRFRVRVLWPAITKPIEQLQDYVKLLEVKTADGKPALTTEEFRNNILKKKFNVQISENVPQPATTPDETKVRT